MNPIDKANLQYFHKNLIEVHPDETAQAVGWKEQKGQEKRFEILASIGDLNNASILDLGCGCGDLKKYLDGRFSNFHYIGVDLMPEFIETAKERFKDAEHTWFYHGDFSNMQLPEMDYILISGALTYKVQEVDYHTSMIEKIYNCVNKGFGFNMLTANAKITERKPFLIGHDLQTIKSFCETICPNTQVITGYLEEDFTVFMYK